MDSELTEYELAALARAGDRAALGGHVGLTDSVRERAAPPRWGGPFRSVELVGVVAGLDGSGFSGLPLTGALAELADELAVAEDVGTDAIPMTRSLQRRLLQLAPLRARLDAGQAMDAVLASIFWKDRAAVGRMPDAAMRDEIVAAARAAR